MRTRLKCKAGKKLDWGTRGARSAGVSEGVGTMSQCEIGAGRAWNERSQEPRSGQNMCKLGMKRGCKRKETGQPEKATRVKP